MEVRRVTQAEASELLGFPAPAGGFLLPYFDLSGEPTGFFRIRFDDYFDPWARQLGRKPIRYRQAAKTNAEVYFPPLVNWVSL